MFAVATLDTVGYKVMMFLHITSVVVAFAPAFVVPVVTAKLRAKGQALGPDVGAVLAANTTKVHGPALVAAGFFGYGLVGMSKKAIGFGDLWITTAGTLWLIAIGVVFGLIGPQQRKAAAGDQAAAKKLPMFNGIVHLLFAGLLLLMVFQPS